MTPRFARQSGLNARIRIERVKRVSRDCFGLCDPRVQWGWGVFLDSAPHGKPHRRLKSAKYFAHRLSETLPPVVSK